MRDRRHRSRRIGRYVSDHRAYPGEMYYPIDGRHDRRTRTEMRDRNYRSDMSRYDDMREPRERDYGYPRDYRSKRDFEDEYMSDDDLMEWAKELLHEVPEQDKPLFTKESIERKARDIGIDFGKDYTFEDFYTAVLMQYTDYSIVFGAGNLDLYAKMAKAWLEDKDIDMDGGEKLAIYYEEIVCSYD